MFPKMKWVLAMIFGCLLTSCSQEPTDVIRVWKEDGWSQVTILGKRGPIERTGVLRSEKAQMIEASWIEEEKEKLSSINNPVTIMLFFAFLKRWG